MPGGRPRKPDAIKRRQGTLRKHRQNKHEPQLPVGAPPIPAHLDALAREEWHRLVAMALKARVLTEADRSILEIAACAYAVWRVAIDVIRAEGLTYETTNTTGGSVIKARPEAAIESDAWRRYKAAVVELGFTPAARSKVNAIDPSEEEDPGAAYLN
jgi:P27 family predicted phage terminase small subunit